MEKKEKKSYIKPSAEVFFVENTLLQKTSNDGDAGGAEEGETIGGEAKGFTIGGEAKGFDLWEDDETSELYW